MPRLSFKDKSYYYYYYKSWVLAYYIYTLRGIDQEYYTHISIKINGDGP